VAAPSELETTRATKQACPTCGAGAPLDAHFCPQCTKILPLPRRADFFSFLGVPRRLNLDPSLLEERFRALSRQFHPDYFYNATPAERRASLERSSYLNDAYRTLRQPAGRIEYLLKLEGLAPDNPREASRKVPPSLLEEVFALNEELDEIRGQRADGAPAETWRARLERARQPIERKRVEHETQLEELAARWDAGAADGERRAVLEALRERMLERNYINNLLATIDREVAGSGLPASGSGPEPPQ
jgi:molecular chaperone HscB